MQPSPKRSRSALAVIFAFKPGKTNLNGHEFRSGIGRDILIDNPIDVAEEIRADSTSPIPPGESRANGRETGVVLLAEAAGGVMRHVIDLYKGLRARDWRVRMVLSPLRIEPRYRNELDLLNQADISYVPMRRGPHLTDLFALAEVAAILKNTPGETILHTHSTKAGMIGAFLRSRARASIFTPHAYRGVDTSAGRFSRAFLRTAERTYSKDYDRILTVAPAELEYARSIGIKEDILRCIPNGLDTSQIRFPEVFERRRPRAGRLCLGFVGRLVYQKNPILFLEILAEVVRRGRDACAIIVGDGSMRGEMLHAAHRLGVADRIDWRGDTPAIRCLPEMDVMVHTSIYEALPYVLIEACADLLPTVATSNCGSEAVFRSRLPSNIASTPEAAEMASILLSIVEDESLLVQQSSIMAKIAQEYSTDTMLSRIEAEYCAVTNNSSRVLVAS